MNRLKIFLLILLIVLVVVGFFLVRRALDTKRFTVNMSNRTVIKELRELNRLETASFTIEKVIDAGTNGGRFQQILFGDRILLIAHGEVIAGFDLSKLSEKDISIEGTTIRLNLPQPEILVARLDSEETRVYDRRQGLLSKGDKDLESEARAAAEQAIQRAACDGDILDEASKNARSQLSTLFKTMQFTTVIINIPEASC